jgi:hypothetical protein
MYQQELDECETLTREYSNTILEKLSDLKSLETWKRHIDDQK